MWSLAALGAPYNSNRARSKLAHPRNTHSKNSQSLIICLMPGLALATCAAAASVPSLPNAKVCLLATIPSLRVIRTMLHSSHITRLPSISVRWSKRFHGTSLHCPARPLHETQQRQSASTTISLPVYNEPQTLSPRDHQRGVRALWGPNNQRARRNELGVFNGHPQLTITARTRTPQGRLLAICAHAAPKKQL